MQDTINRSYPDRLHKRGLAALSVGAMILGGCAAGGETGEEAAATGEGGAETVEMIASSGVSAEHGWHVGFFDPWLEEVAEETDGAVDIEMFTSGELVPLGDELEPLQTGSIDLAVPLLTGYDPGSYPLSEVTMLPLGESDAEIAGEAYRKLMESDVELADGMNYYEYEFGSKGLKAWPLPPTGSYVLATAGAEIDSLASLQGMQIRGAARANELFIEALGATPVTISATELFDALSRGAVDAAMFSIADWSGYGLQEQFSTTIDGLTLGHFSSVAAMTQDAWEDLDAEVQEAFDAAAATHYPDGSTHWETRTEEVREENRDSGGEFVSVGDLPQEVDDAIAEAIETTWLEWIDRVEEQGHPGREVAVLWRDLIIEAGGTVPAGVEDL